MKLLFIVLSLVTQFWNTEGTCRCLDQRLCGDPVSGCNYRCQPGFTGKNCQHDNLGYKSASNVKEIFDGDYSTCLRLPRSTKINFIQAIDVDTIRVHRRNNHTGVFYSYVYTNTRQVTLWTNNQVRAEGPAAATHFHVQTGVTEVQINNMGMVCEVEVTNEKALATESPRTALVPVCNTYHCDHGGTCHNQEGTLVCECTAGYTGTRCESALTTEISQTASPAPCNLHCGDRGTCKIEARKTVCECQAGYRGTRCGKTLTTENPRTAAPVLCNLNCRGRGTCKIEAGKTVCECQAGYRGKKCGKKCSKGSYGSGCTKSCAVGCEDGDCNHVNGSCVCKPGWMGDKCSQRCTSTYYGSGCSHRCAKGCVGRDCNHVNGSCVCKPGWISDKCSEICSPGFYGANCEKSCNEGCQPQHCDHVTGNCKYRCRDGWRGWSCQTKCDRGKYGSQCQETCGSNCQTCHHVNGSCGHNCKSGWFGENCDRRCELGTYGDGCSSRCNEGCVLKRCDPINGDCTGHCRDGWTGHNCLQPCGSGVYGESCLSKCSEGCVNKSCNRSNGACGDCLIGWTHSDNYLRCDNKCDNGTFGKGCVEQCSVNCLNRICHYEHGACLLGCNEGWKGDNCQEHQAVVSQNGLMYASLVLVLLLVALVVVLLVVFRNRIKDCLFTATDRADDNNIPMTGRKAAVIDHVSFADENVVRNNDETVYANQPDSASSTCVTIAGLKDYVTRKREKKKTLLDEYAKLPPGLITAYDIALTDENSPKNRFREIYPYNHSLVHIKTATGKPGYINASFIDGPMREKQYIATQGPLPHTVEDFLEMIWQYNIAVVVMLANIVEDGKKRCEQYWPHEVNVPVLTFGYINVSVADECSYADFTVRTLHLRKGRLSRSVKHVHYTVWPDKGVPDDTISLIALRHKVRSLWDLDAGPLVVHCSAGVGRTGTLMALDYLMEQADHQNRVDIFGCVWSMRGNRVKMVQTDIQYVFLHDCLLDALIYTRPPIPSSVFLKEYKQLKKDSSTELTKKYKHLEETPVPDRPHTVATNNENSNKNRSMDILPGDLHRAYLMYPVPGHTDYINAVMAPSFRRRNALIMTQTPLVTTVVDLWRLIKDHNVRGLVLLDNYTAADEGCGVFWADEGQSCNFGPFSITRGKTEQHTGFSVEDYEYKTNESEGIVSLFRCSFWPQQSSLPESDSRLLCFLDFIRQWDSGKSPLVVICRDGCTRSGLYCVLSNVLERLVLEKEVAINNAIRRLRLVRKQVIPTLEQFEFCHDAVKTYIESFHDYTNM